MPAVLGESLGIGSEYMKSVADTGVLIPRVILRATGGWLAVSEPGAFLSIGVTGTSEDDARERFAWAVHEWTMLLDRRDMDTEQIVQ